MLRISAQHRIGGRRRLVGWIAVAAVLASACTAGPEVGGPGSPPAVSVTPSAPGAGSVTEAERAAAEPKPTPTPTPTGRGDFCTHYRAMAKWSFDHQARPTPEAWAAELVRRLTVMRPLAPADKLAWVSALLRVYRLVAEGAGAAAIGNEVATSNFPAAGRGLALYCKVDPALLHLR